MICDTPGITRFQSDLFFTLRVTIQPDLMASPRLESVTDILFQYAGHLPVVDAQ